MKDLSLALPSDIQTMSSREIAELTGKAHKHVIRDIKEMLESLYEYPDGPNLGHLPEDVLELKDSRGYTSEFKLDRKHTDCLLTGYNTKARMKVIKRWHELEQANAKPMTQLEIAQMSINMLVEQEKRLSEAQVAVKEVKEIQSEQAELLKSIANDMEDFKDNEGRPTTPPDGFGSATRLGKELRKRYGISASIVGKLLPKLVPEEHTTTYFDRPPEVPQGIFRDCYEICVADEVIAKFFQDAVPAKVKNHFKHPAYEDGNFRINSPLKEWVKPEVK